MKVYCVSYETRLLLVEERSAGVYFLSSLFYAQDPARKTTLFDVFKHSIVHLLRAADCTPQIRQSDRKGPR